MFRFPPKLIGTAAAVVYVKEAAVPLEDVLIQLQRLPLEQLIVVVNPEAAIQMEQLSAVQGGNIQVVALPDGADADVGRALGANLTKTDMVLFVDGRRLIPAEMLARFLIVCDLGTDLVLNDLGKQKKLFHRRSGTQRLYAFLNMSLRRPDLAYNSLAVLPCVLSRKAIRTIGNAALATPVKAHALAVMKKLTFGAQPAGALPDEAARLPVAIAQHAQAWQAAMAIRGDRLGFSDHRRKRRVLQEH